MYDTLFKILKTKKHKLKKNLSNVIYNYLS